MRRLGPISRLERYNAKEGALMSDSFCGFIKCQKVEAFIFPSHNPLIPIRNRSLSEAFRPIDLHISKGASVGNTESLV